MKKSRFPKKGFFVDSNIRKAEGLPKEAFTDPEFLALEFDRLFYRSWLLVPPSARADLFHIKGAQTPFSMLGQPLFLQYDTAGTLRAYPNVCTHASYPLVKRANVVDRVVCGQHGRSFALDGTVCDPKFRDAALFPRACDNLKALPLAEWEDLTFISLENPAHSFDAVFGPMQETMRYFPIPRMRRVIRSRENEVREVEGNWKQHAWNYTDSLHIPLIHHAPDGLADAADLSSYKTECHGDSLLQWVYARDPESGFAPECLPEHFRDKSDFSRRVLALWWFVFPNMAFNFYPWGLSLNLYMPIPGRPDKTLFHWYHYVADEHLYAMRESIWHMEKVDCEDTEAIEATARGLRSLYAVRGLFAAKREVGPHWFHRRVYAALFGET